MGELLPYGTTGLVFKEGNETVEDEVVYRAYMNQYVIDHNIPGVRFEHDEDILPILDRLTVMLQEMMREDIFIESGTPVFGEVAESDSVQILMDEPLPKTRKRKTV